MVRSQNMAHSSHVCHFKCQLNAKTSLLLSERNVPHYEKQKIRKLEGFNPSYEHYSTHNLCITIIMVCI